MKNKLLLSVPSLLLILGIYVSSSYSQTFNCALTNPVQVSNSIYKFDVHLLRTSADPFQLYKFQLVLSYDTTALNGGSLTAEWTNLDPTIIDSGMTPPTPNTDTAGIIFCRGTTPSGGLTAAPFLTDVIPGMTYGTLVLTNSVPFKESTGSSPVANSFVSNKTLGMKYEPNTLLFDELLKIGYKLVFPLGSFVLGVIIDPIGVITDPIGTVVDVTALGLYYVDLLWPPHWLPAELSSFASNVQGRNIILNWTTQTEKNSDKFIIERKTLSTNWEAMGSIKASVLSNSPKQYSYSDKNLQSGKYQYRLKMIDNDGTFEYSKVIETEITVPKNFELSQNFPNPFNPSTKINYNLPFDSKVTLEVFNITGERIGQLVNEEQSAGYYSIDFNSSLINRSISSGVYFYRITAVDKASGNNFSAIKKMVLLK